MNSNNLLKFLKALSMLIAFTSNVLLGTARVLIPLMLAAAGIALFVGICYFLITAILILMILCEVLCLFNLFCDITMFLSDVVNGRE